MIHNQSKKSHLNNIFDQPGLVHIWQGLLLVQAQLTQEHLHLTSSSSFAAKVASIIAKISTPLEQADAQARYLSFIGKLWAVIKNVFKSSWLCSPAEIILATLLKKQFSFSDGQVKDLWSQLCTDLIAVGIPTVLHVLHVRSESQEDTDVTRQLWLILANYGPATGEEDWMSLLYFLVMPFECDWSFFCFWTSAKRPSPPVYGSCPASKLKYGTLSLAEQSQ